MNKDNIGTWIINRKQLMYKFSAEIVHQCYYKYYIFPYKSHKVNLDHNIIKELVLG